MFDSAENLEKFHHFNNYYNLMSEDDLVGFQLRCHYDTPPPPPPAHVKRGSLFSKYLFIFYFFIDFSQLCYGNGCTDQHEI